MGFSQRRKKIIKGAGETTNLTNKTRQAASGVS